MFMINHYNQQMWWKGLLYSLYNFILHFSYCFTKLGDFLLNVSVIYHIKCIKSWLLIFPRNEVVGLVKHSHVFKTKLLAWCSSLTGQTTHTRRSVWIIRDNYKIHSGYTSCLVKEGLFEKLWQNMTNTKWWYFNLVELQLLLQFYR